MDRLRKDGRQESIVSEALGGPREMDTVPACLEACFPLFPLVLPQLTKKSHCITKRSRRASAVRPGFSRRLGLLGASPSRARTGAHRR
jgi:hypothetical protein